MYFANVVFSRFLPLRVASLLLLVSTCLLFTVRQKRSFESTYSWSTGLQRHDYQLKIEILAGRILNSLSDLKYTCLAPDGKQYTRYQFAKSIQIKTNILIGSKLPKNRFELLQKIFLRLGFLGGVWPKRWYTKGSIYEI